MMGEEQHDFYKVNSLTNLDKASPVEGTVVWDAPRSLWNGAMLLGAIVLGPLTFSWSALAVFLITAGVSFYNAAARNRLSQLDITTDREEPDPLNQRVPGISVSAEAKRGFIIFNTKANCRP